LGRKIDGAQLSRARTEEFDLERKKVSGRAGWLGGLGVIGELPGIPFYR
jgi:hypothetical protein